MKPTKIIYILIIIFFFFSNLFSQNINSSEKTRLLIYDFITYDNYALKKTKQKNYQYYSIVIPETVSKSMGKSGNYTIRREAGPLSVKADYEDINEKNAILTKLADLGNRTKSDYIITGTFHVENSRLSLQITIFNVKEKLINTVNHESDETGVELQNTTDKLSQLIRSSIDNLNSLQETSPFIGLYTPLSTVTVGIDSGYLFILGEWSKTYNNPLYVSPFMDIDLTDQLSLSLKLTSIQSDSYGKNIPSFSQIRMLSSSFSLCFFNRTGSSSGIALSAGGGITYTTITVQPQQPFSDPGSEKNMADPSIDISAYLVYNPSTYTFRTGILYKEIFFKNKPMYTGIIFAGAGIHF